VVYPEVVAMVLSVYMPFTSHQGEMKCFVRRDFRVHLAVMIE